MNRKFKTIAVAVLLMSVAFLIGGCKKCECNDRCQCKDNCGCKTNEGSCQYECGCDDGVPPPPVPIVVTYSGTNAVNTNCVQFTDKWKALENGTEHAMQVKLLCVNDADTNRLELDGTCIKEFYGQEEAEVTKIVENGSHRILCYTVGTTDTVVNVTFEQDENGRVNNWNTHIHL